MGRAANRPDPIRFRVGAGRSSRVTESPRGLESDSVEWLDSMSGGLEVIPLVVDQLVVPPVDVEFCAAKACALAINACCG